MFDRPARPLASLSLDLDNLWSYMMIHGDPGWEALPSYLDRLAEIAGGWLARKGLNITIFVVGKDAAQPSNEGALRALFRGGHEVGNHSFSHEPWVHTYTREEIVREIGEAEAHIERVIGQRPRGFRGPGFSLSEGTLAVLKERGYLYDASTFPTILGPLARAYYFFSAPRLAPEEQAKREKLFGSAADGLQPVRPYVWRGLPGGSLLEIPVTTAPLLRVPIHMSYLGYLGQRSRWAARTWLKAALALCARTGVEPSFLLHPLDFMGGDEVEELAFFPGMAMKTTRKLALLDEMIDLLGGRFEIVTMEAHARALLERGDLPDRSAAGR